MKKRRKFFVIVCWWIAYFNIVTYQSSNVNFRPWTTLTLFQNVSHNVIREFLTHHSPHIVYYNTEKKLNFFKKKLKFFVCLIMHSLSISIIHIFYDITWLYCVLNFSLHFTSSIFLWNMKETRNPFPFSFTRYLTGKLKKNIQEIVKKII